MFLWYIRRLSENESNNKLLSTLSSYLYTVTNYETLMFIFLNQNGTSFSVSVGPVPEGETCDLTIVQGRESVTLKNVLFGDVYICSGMQKEKSLF